MLPPVVVARALESGAAGREWLAHLDGRVADLEDRWHLRVVETLPGGSGAFVARVRTEDGTSAVLKVPIPDECNERVVRLLTRADGRGYVRLLRSEHGALLLEDLGLSLADSGLPVARRLDLLGRLLPTAWQSPSAADEPVDKAAGLLEFVEERVDGRTGPALAKALEFARRRSATFDPEHAVVLHGDPAPGQHPARARAASGRRTRGRLRRSRRVHRRSQLRPRGRAARLVPAAPDVGEPGRAAPQLLPHPGRRQSAGPAGRLGVGVSRTRLDGSLRALAGRRGARRPLPRDRGPPGPRV